MLDFFKVFCRIAQIIHALFQHNTNSLFFIQISNFNGPIFKNIASTFSKRVAFLICFFQVVHNSNLEYFEGPHL